MKKTWFKSKFGIMAILFALASVAYAAGIPQKIVTDLLVLGKGSSTDPKQIEFNTGDSPNNVILGVDDSRNTTLTSNLLGIGDGTDTAMIFRFDQATGDIDFQIDASQNASLNSDQFTLGDGTASDKRFIFDRGGSNGEIRWSETNSRLEFSNDGTAYKAVGSGGGAGGRNLLIDSNFDFEVGDPPSDWTASGGTFTAVSGGSQLYGSQSGQWDSNALSQTLKSAAVSVEPGMRDRVCLAQLFYSYETGTSGDYELRIEHIDDSEATTSDIVIQPLEITSSDKGVPSEINFQCPDDTADTLEMRLESTVADADAIKIDDAFIGTDKNTFRSSQARVVASGNWGSNCPPTTTSASFVFASNANCAAPSFTTIDTSMVEQGVDYDGMRVVLNNARKGTYSVRISPLRISVSGNNQVAGIELRANGTPIADYQFRSGAFSEDLHPFNIEGTYENTTDGDNVQFDLFISMAGGFSFLVDSGKSGASSAFEIVYHPKVSDEAISIDKAGGTLKATFGTDCVLARANTSYQIPVGDASCTFTGTTDGPFSNLVTATDSGNTTSGLIFDASRNMEALACVSGSMVEASASASFLSVRLYDQTNSIEYGSQTIRFSPDTNRQGAWGWCEPVNIKAGSNQFNIEIQASGGGTAQISNGSGNAITWSFVATDQGLPIGYFPDITNGLNNRILKASSSESRNVRVTSATIANPAGTCTIDTSSNPLDGNDWLDSVGINGTGQCDLSPSAGVFSARPQCVVSPIQQNGPYCTMIGVPSNSLIQAKCFDAAHAAFNTTFQIICIGPTN